MKLKGFMLLRYSCRIVKLHDKEEFESVAMGKQVLNLTHIQILQSWKFPTTYLIAKR